MGSTIGEINPLADLIVKKMCRDTTRQRMRTTRGSAEVKRGDAICPGELHLFDM